MIVTCSFCSAEFERKGTGGKHPRYFCTPAHKHAFHDGKAKQRRKVNMNNRLCVDCEKEIPGPWTGLCWPCHLKYRTTPVEGRDDITPAGWRLKALKNEKLGSGW